MWLAASNIESIQVHKNSFFLVALFVHTSFLKENKHIDDISINISHFPADLHTEHTLFLSWADFTSNLT